MSDSSWKHTLKGYWKDLKNGEPGKRFQEVYESRKEERDKRSRWSRLLWIGFAVLLILIGLAIGWLPGPGGFVAFIGIGILAMESRWLTCQLDKWEVRLRRWKDHWSRRLSSPKSE